MNKKILSLIWIHVILLIAISISACGAETPTATVTVAPQEPSTATLAPATKPPAVTNTSAPTLPSENTATPAPSATLPPPDNAVDCINLGKFVSDVTIPDNSEVNTGETFTKTWRVKNTGTCIWWDGYSVAHYSEGSFGAPEKSPLPRTNPGANADVSVDLVAPSAPGIYQGYFVLENPEGLPMEIEGDSRLSVVFNAVNSGTPEVDATSSDVSTPVVSITPTNGATTCSYSLDGTRRDGLFAAINTYRIDEGLTPYAMNQELADAAQAHAQDMACNQLFGHVGSDGSTPQERVEEVGYTAIVTENVYGSNPPLSPEEVKEWWRLDTEEPEHGENLISTEYADIGIGYAFFDSFGYYVVVFGKGE